MMIRNLLAGRDADRARGGRLQLQRPVEQDAQPALGRSWSRRRVRLPRWHEDGRAEAHQRGQGQGHR